MFFRRVLLGVSSAHALFLALAGRTWRWDVHERPLRKMLHAAIVEIFKGVPVAGPYSGISPYCNPETVILISGYAVGFVFHGVTKN